MKEKGDSLVFQPHCSRSVMGKNLSIVGKACGIRQRLSYHVARHTFGTMSLSAGIPIESIAKMMGHASISSTQVYAQVTDNKISEDMDRLIAKQSAKIKKLWRERLLNFWIHQSVKWKKRHEYEL